MKRNYLWWLRIIYITDCTICWLLGAWKTWTFIFSKKDWFWEFHLKLELTTVAIFSLIYSLLFLDSSICYALDHTILFNKQKQNVILIIAFQSYEDTWVEPIYLHTRWLNSLHFGMRNAYIFVFKLQWKNKFFIYAELNDTGYKITKEQYNNTPTKS